MCVLEILVLKIFLDWEIFVLIGSLVELYVGLHSYLCFSHLDTSSTPCYLSSFSSIFLNTISTPPQYLVDRSSFCSWIWFFVARYLLDTSAVDDQFLDTYLNNFLDTSWYLSCRALLKGLYILPSRFFSHFFDLSRSVRDCSSPKHSPFHSKLVPQGFFKLFQVSFYLVSF